MGPTDRRKGLTMTSRTALAALLLSGLLLAALAGCSGKDVSMSAYNKV